MTPLGVRLAAARRRSEAPHKVDELLLLFATERRVGQILGPPPTGFLGRDSKPTTTHAEGKKTASPPGGRAEAPR